MSLPVGVILAVLALAVSAATGQQLCDEFTLGECVFNDDSVIESWTIPNTPTAPITCQELCRIEDECNYFTYRSDTETCLLYHYFDLVACGLVSGTKTPPFYDCLPQPGSHICKDFSQFNCTFDSPIVQEQPNILYPAECQSVLNTIGDLIGAEYFVYDGQRRTCTLHKSPKRFCPGTCGPDFPRIDNCYDFPTSSSIAPSSTLSTSTVPPLARRAAP